MEIGIGLPNTMEIDGLLVARWARRAEERGFSTLATIDRIVYPTYDSLTTLSVAAGATERIGLFTDILLAPAYNPIWLAKATASLHAMSGGRLTLGLGVGGRPDDYAAMNRDFDRRPADGRDARHPAAGLAGREPGDRRTSPAEPSRWHRHCRRLGCRCSSAATASPRCAAPSRWVTAGPPGAVDRTRPGR